MSVSQDKDINIRLSLLEQDMKRANNALLKMEENAEKHRENHSQITERIYDRMEEVRSELKTEMAELKKSFEEQLKTQNELLTQINTKLNDLDKWRWIVVGIATAIGFVLSKLTGLFDLHLK